MQLAKMYTVALMMMMISSVVSGQYGQSYPPAHPVAPYPPATPNAPYKPPSPSPSFPRSQPPNPYPQSPNPYRQPPNPYSHSPAPYQQPANPYAANYRNPPPYVPGQASSVPRSYPPSQPPSRYSPAPAYAPNPFPQSPNPYSYPQILYPYPQNALPYHPNPYVQPNNHYITYTKEPEDCTDQSCETDECCEFNGKRKVCVRQDLSINAGLCVRPKRCDTNGDCPTGHCCVIRLDVPYKPPSYPTYGVYYKREKEERGECILSALEGEACRRTADGLQTSVCPCAPNLQCIFPSGNLLIGMCA